MKKELIRYGFLTLILVFVFAFIYPTLYRYDKYDQKFPVKINRITGNTEMLSSQGWINPEGYKPTDSEMTIFKKEMTAKFDGIRTQIEADVSNKLTKNIIDSIQSNIDQAKLEVQVEIDKAMVDIHNYKMAQTDPNNSFEKGSPKDVVKKIMGVPTSTLTSYNGDETWFYGSSSIEFIKGKVSDWSNI